MRTDGDVPSRPHTDVRLADSSHEDRSGTCGASSSRDPAISLNVFDGTQQDVVTIGTVYRAKGMDFGGVFHITDAPKQLPGQLTDAERDRTELAARHRRVTLIRAGDYVRNGFMQD